MGHQSSKVEIESFRTLVVRDAFSGEELCQLHNVETATTGLELKERIQKSVDNFAASTKRLLWGPTILCDHLTLREVIACSLSNDGFNPSELTVLTRPATVQRWLQNHKQLNDQRIIYNSWTSWQHNYYRYNSTGGPARQKLMNFLSQPRYDQAVQELQNGGDDISSDVECMAALMLDDGFMLQHASIELQEVDFLVLTAVKQNGLILEYASQRLQDTDVIVSTAVKQNGLALQHASSRLQDTDSIVSIAVKQNGLALQHASCRLQNKDLLVSDAVKQNGFAIQYASSNHKNDDWFVRKALHQNPNVLEILSPKFQDDWSIVYIAFRQDPSTQRYASARIQARCIM